MGPPVGWPVFIPAIIAAGADSAPVNASTTAAKARQGMHHNETGKLTLSLRGRMEKLSVSRMYSQQFRAM